MCRDEIVAEQVGLNPRQSQESILFAAYQLAQCIDSDPKAILEPGLLLVNSC